MKPSRSLAVVAVCCVAAVTAVGCRSTAPERVALAVDDVKKPPKPTAADQRYRNVFALLDGRWTGSFEIYVDGRGQQPGPRPRRVDVAVLRKAPYRLLQTIRVEQHYRSETPFFQRVTIRDRYKDASGAEKTVVSEGANKVQGGALWCVVKKPDDLVVHRGALEGKQTIVWTRSRKRPLAIERFHETVSAARYTISGWGYYGKDDPELAPRMFFHAVYTRPGS